MVAQLTIHERERHQRYTAGLMAVVLLAVSNRSAYEAWASSAADPRIAQDRIAATEGPVLVVRGIS